MGSAEEQELELEALTSIFEEGREFEKVSDTEFKLFLVPHQEGEGENHVGVTLHVFYTANYPEEAPNWMLEDVKGLPDDKPEELKSLIEETISSSMGMAMVYTIAEACQDFLKENNIKELSMHEQMMNRMKEAGGEDPDAEGEEGDEFDEDDLPDPEVEWRGLAEKHQVPEDERITVKCFLEWKAKFDAEMVATGLLKRDEKKGKSGKVIFLEAKAAAEGTEGDEQGVEGNKVYDTTLCGEDMCDEEDADSASGAED